jgi:hypothetical protein
LSRDESGALRRAVDRGIDALGLLRHPADRPARGLETGNERAAGAGSRAGREGSLPAIITPPAPDPQAWTCPRCGKVYMKMQYARQHAGKRRLQATACAPRCTCRGRGTPPGHGEEAARDVAGAHGESAARRQRGAVGQSPVELPRRVRAPPVVDRPPARSLRQLPVAGKPATAARGKRRLGLRHGRLRSR